MRSTLRRFAFVTGLALVVLVPVLVLAQTQGPPQGRGMMGGRGMGGPGGGMFQALQLTEQQRSQVQTIMEQHRQATQDVAKQAADLQQQLKAAIFADGGPNDGAIASLKAQLAGIEAQLQAGRLDMQKQIATLLTPEQRKKVRDMPGMGPFGGPGPGGRGRGFGRGFGHGMHAGW